MKMSFEIIIIAGQVVKCYPRNLDTIITAFTDQESIRSKQLFPELKKIKSVLKPHFKFSQQSAHLAEKLLN